MKYLALAILLIALAGCSNGNKVGNKIGVSLNTNSDIVLNGESEPLVVIVENPYHSLTVDVEAVIDWSYDGDSGTYTGSVSAGPDKTSLIVFSPGVQNNYAGVGTTELEFSVTLSFSNSTKERKIIATRELQGVGTIMAPN